MHAAKQYPHIYALSERAVTIEFGDEISEDTLQRISSFNNLLKQNPFPGFYASVPAYTTLSVFYDPLQVILSKLTGGDCFEKVSGYLNRLKDTTDHETALSSSIITIPVCYGGDYGPDIAEVAALHDLSVEQVISLHSEVVYTVYMIGFVPGFAYMGGMSEHLATPRKPTPRGAIPAGSVGIAGMQTGIYPLETPGGWQIIGRTPLRLFDVGREQPSLLKGGDKVGFKPVAPDEFEYLSNS